MQVYVKETLHVLDYQDNIVGTIFNSDDHRSPGYAFNISITEANTGYSDLRFDMPNIIINDKGDKIKNPLQALLTPLVKLRYHREVYYTGETPITVREPQGYGDQVEYIDKIYSNVYPDNIIEDYIMDYIVQPVDTKRDVLKTTTSFTAMDYPRFNLSKKRVGLNITQDTLTREEWSLFENKPMDEPGTIKYQPWTTALSTTAGNSNIPLVWDPENAKEYPLNKTEISRLMANAASWPYGLLATAFYWPIVSTARFEGVLYKKGGFLVLQLYDFYNLSTEGIDPDLYVGRYSWEWTQLYEVDSYLCPNNALNYLYHILEGTNWSVALKPDGTPDVDIVKTTVPNPRGSTSSSEEVDKTSNINISNSNCYNAITATCQALQLYPVFDCVNRTVALHEFAGKNYGLVYALGKNISNDSTKADGEKVITKLYCSGGKDYDGDSNINIGTAERSYIKTFTGFYRTLPSASNVEGYWCIVDNSIPASNFNKTVYELQENAQGEAELVPVIQETHDTSVQNYWMAGSNRKVYFLNNNQWVLGTQQPSGLWQGVVDGRTVLVDPITGTSGEWSPNDDMYINSRSPYGTNYILNLKWAYQNNWITKEQILELYQYEMQINDLNVAFMDKYIEDYRNTRQLYNEAVNNYDIAQDGFESTLYAMENKYYNTENYSEGSTYCFHKAPKGTYIKNNLHYIKLFHCYECGHTEAIAPNGSNPGANINVCPNQDCGSHDVVNNEIYIPIYDDYKDEYNWDERDTFYPYGTDVTRQYEGHRYNPHLKGYFQRLVMSLDRANGAWSIEDYENRVSMIDIIPFENSTVSWEDGYTYKLNGVYVRSTSGQIEVWNDAILTYIENYGNMLSYLRTVNAMLDRIQKLDEIYDQWNELIFNLNATIQEKFGDYLIEGNYTNNEQPYVNLLFNEGLEASDKYSVPEITYNLNVIDSSGLIEYREPTITKYRCAECDYISYTPITSCPRCENELIVTENDIYNDLVRLLHSVGQIVPKAGDYVTIYDEPMGMYGVPGLITQITRYPDNPINNRIELNTSYTDDEELVGNIITATNTVLNNADIYARTAVLKTDGTLDADSLKESLDDSNANITIVGTNGNILLDGSGLRATDPTDSHRAMKYAGNGIFNTSNLDNAADEAVIWEKMMSPSGINATYINSGTIDTNKINIMSGLSGKVLLDQYGLSVKQAAGKTSHITEFSSASAKSDVNYAKNWGTNNNIASFVGVDGYNNPLIYTKGFLVAEEGSNIANWITSNEGFYHLSTGSDGNGYKDLWLSPTGLNRSNYNHRSGNTNVVAKLGGTTDNIFSFYTNDTFGVTPDGDLYSTSGQIGGFNITASKLYSTNANSHITGMASSSYAGDPAFYAGGGDPWSTSGWANSTPFYVTNEGFLKATNANITGTITTDNLTATGGSISNLTANNITATNLTMSSGSITLGSNFKVTSDGKLTCSSASIKGSISASTISGTDISGGSISGTSISGGTITGTTFRTNKVDGVYRTIFDSSGSIKYYNGVGYLTCGLVSDTNHPWLSGVNVNYTNGISFRNGTTWGNAGDEIDYIRHSGSSLHVHSGGRLNLYGSSSALDAGSGYLRLSAGNTSAAGSNDGSVYITASSHINLHAGSGGHVYAGANGWNGGSNAWVTTDKGDISSRSTKTNIHEMPLDTYQDALNLLKHMKLYTYDYKYDLYDKPAQYGFILDEIEEEDKKHHFLDITDRPAWTKGRYISFNMDEKPSNDDKVEEILTKHYDRDVFSKYLLTCIKALQNEIEDLKQLKKEETN